MKAVCPLLSSWLLSVPFLFFFLITFTSSVVAVVEKGEGQQLRKAFIAMAANGRAATLQPGKPPEGEVPENANEHCPGM